MSNQSYRQIASLRIGDRVASRNELTGRYSSNLITALPGRLHDDKVTMQLEGADGRLETIVTTLEHPFYIAGRGFVEAGDMKTGMKVSRWQSRAPPAASAVNSLSGFQPSAPLVQTVDYRKADSTKSLLSRWLSQASEWLGFKATPAQAAPRSALATKSQSLLVKSISITRSGLKSWRAYNLTVANDHTYFVGKQKAWVHNCQKLADASSVIKDDLIKLDSKMKKKTVATVDGKTAYVSGWADLKDDVLKTVDRFDLTEVQKFADKYGIAFKEHKLFDKYGKPTDFYKSHGEVQALVANPNARNFGLTVKSGLMCPSCRGVFEKYVNEIGESIIVTTNKYKYTFNPGKLYIRDPIK